MNVTLRNLEEKDAIRMLEWMHDDNVTHYLKLDGTNATLESTLNFIKEANNQKENLHYAIADEYDDYLGTISLKNIDLGKREAEFAIVLHSSAMGKGVATRAMQILLEKVKQEKVLNRIYLNVLQENKRAEKLYKKVGFKYIETSRINVYGRMEQLDWYEYQLR